MEEHWEIIWNQFTFQATFTGSYPDKHLQMNAWDPTDPLEKSSLFWHSPGKSALTFQWKLTSSNSRSNSKILLGMIPKICYGNVKKKPTSTSSIYEPFQAFRLSHPRMPQQFGNPSAIGTWFFLGVSGGYVAESGELKIQSFSLLNARISQFHTRGHSFWLTTLPPCNQPKRILTQMENV